jgi:Flp pilus assembly protein TadD
MKFIKVLFITMTIMSVSILTVGCQLTEKIYQPQNTFVKSELYADDYFIGYQNHQLKTENEIFQLSPEMVDLIDKNIHAHKSLKQQVFDLLNLIFDEKQLGLAYKNSANLTASQTFKNREANCISLTIMAYALAKHANLTVQFRDVEVPEYWIRNGGYNLLTGHVNLVVSENKVETQEYIFNSTSVVIDFDPYIRKKEFPSKIISKNKITAMFYTNVAAQAIIKNNFTLAYAYLKKATEYSASYSPAWGNLGILYRMVGLDQLAINAYEHAITLNPKNYTSITNLAIVFNKVGRYEDAKLIQKKLHDLRIKNPYYHALLAREAFYQAEYQTAISRYQLAIKLNGQQHEFYYGLAKVYAQIGDGSLARKALKKAIKLNKYPDIDKQYYAKLNLLSENMVN